MSDPKQLRLVCQLSVPVVDVIDGDAFYTILKRLVKHRSDKAMISGQLILMLEPCCGPKVNNAPNTITANPPQR